MTQPDLFAAKAPAVTPADVEWLVFRLRGCGWVRAREMRGSDRRLRAVASASLGRIISGQKGYCLIEEATVEEARHAAAWLRHQGTEMIRRASEIERAMHKRHAA